MINIETNLEFIEYCKKTYSYDKETGEIKHIRYNRICETDNGRGYFRLGMAFNKKAYMMLNHRLAFLLLNLPIPKTIDHIDGNKHNNKWENLREITQKNNIRKQIKHKNSSSKYKGVYYHKIYNKWEAQIYVNNKQIHLGLFANELEAALVYDKFAILYFGEFANTNKQLGILCNESNENSMRALNNANEENEDD